MSDGQAAAAATKSGAPAPDPLLGRVIADRYKIIDLIARGGMGKVYRAEQAPLGRACALKVLNPNYNGDADPEFHRRFFREASIASQISHPNSVTIFDYGKTDDDIFYMSMEYLEGQTLHHALREVGTFHEERVGRIAQQICRALREAHALGVIHRDLKPANIFLTRHGDDEDFVKVLDFGLVKHLSERPEEQLTQTGLFMGSPKYMAPEQIQGGVVDARTDVYSLGIIMYEMIAGKVPFDRATSVNILMAHVGEPPPPMREVNPNLICSVPFEELIMRCISKDPKERFGSMDEVLQALKRVHGASMTGMLGAVTMSGAFMAQSAPPPGVNVTGLHSQLNASAAHAMQMVAHAGNAPSITPPPHHLAPGVSNSGAHTPMGVARTDSGLPDFETSQPFAPRRSRLWILVGVVLAAVVGGGLGMVAFRITAPQLPEGASSAHASASSAPASAPGASGASSVSTTSAPAVSSSPESKPSAVEAKSIVVRVTTDPPGASVKEDAVEHCASTPCDVTFKDDDGSKVHKLLVAKAGFKPEARSVKGSEGPLTVKLVHAGFAGGGGHVRPPTPPVTPAPAPKPTTDPAPTPSGFKDLPY